MERSGQTSGKKKNRQMKRSEKRFNLVEKIEQKNDNRWRRKRGK